MPSLLKVRGDGADKPGNVRPNLATAVPFSFFQTSVIAMAQAQAAIHDVYDTILILDFGSQVSSWP